MACKVNKKKQHGKAKVDKLGAPHRRPSVFRWLPPLFRGGEPAPRRERWRTPGGAVFARAARIFFRPDNSFGAETTTRYVKMVVLVKIFEEIIKIRIKMYTFAKL
ncbi:hypothetical protein HMPREF1640_08060 [Prevotella sp. S7-1-8]|nr:hypothetical protein HMPREF1640_08060 [Prevotella sp. S7-1-8]